MEMYQLASDKNNKRINLYGSKAVIEKEKQVLESLKLAGISDTQLYRQAGNSIVVNVLQTIFENLSKNY